MAKVIICEVCEEPVKSMDDLSGCEKCGDMFGPCCNNATNSDYCVECDPPDDEE